MIDLHCHLLPDIDDGPIGLDDSLQMARMAVADGITRSVLTPHIHFGRYENQKSNILQAVANFAVALDDQDIALDIAAAAEVRIGPEIISMINNDEIPFLGELDGYRILLLEMPHENIPPGSANLVNWLLKQKIRPMIAHPERNRDVMADLNKIIPFVSMGCLLQITASSIANKFGEMAHTRSVEMLENSWVNVIATDAHNIVHRPPDLSAGRDAAAEIIGDEEASKLVNGNPMAILGGG